LLAVRGIRESRSPQVSAVTQERGAITNNFDETRHPKRDETPGPLPSRGLSLRNLIEASGCSRFNHLRLGDPHGKHPRDPQENKIER
jgi:hypothetical protein